MVDDVDDTTQPHIIEPQAAITLLTPRKETYLLVSEVDLPHQNTEAVNLLLYWKSPKSRALINSVPDFNCSLTLDFIGLNGHFPNCQILSAFLYVLKKKIISKMVLFSMFVCLYNSCFLSCVEGMLQGDGAVCDVYLPTAQHDGFSQD